MKKHSKTRSNRVVILLVSVSRSPFLPPRSATLQMDFASPTPSRARGRSSSSAKPVRQHPARVDGEGADPLLLPLRRRARGRRRRASPPAPSPTRSCSPSAQSPRTELLPTGPISGDVLGRRRGSSPARRRTASQRLVDVLCSEQPDLHLLRETRSVATEMGQVTCTVAQRGRGPCPWRPLGMWQQRHE